MAERWFLKVDGIDGESTDTGHKGEIDVLAWSWGVSDVGSTGGPGGGGGAGRAEFDDLHVVTRIGKASPKLILAAAAGTHLKSAVLTAVRGSGKSGDAYLTYHLSDVVVTRVDHEADDGDTPIEEVSLGYAKLEISYRPTSASGKIGPPVSAGWDVKANKPL